MLGEVSEAPEITRQHKSRNGPSFEGWVSLSLNNPTIPRSMRAVMHVRGTYCLKIPSPLSGGEKHAGVVTAGALLTSMTKLLACPDVASTS